MQRTKKVVSLLLSLLIALSCFTCLGAVTTFAADGDTAETFLYGDVDGDGRVSIDDATEIQRHLVDQVTLTGDSAKAADVNGDGAITIDDVTLIQQYLVEFIDKFPVEDMPAEETTEAPAEETTETPAEETTEAPAEETTEAPAEETTEAPAEETTEAPAEETTEAPAEETTEAPAEETTEAPAEETTEAPAEEDVVIVAGSPAEIFGTAWDGVNEANTMTKDGDVYTRTYTVDKAYDAVQLKAVVNGADWIGDETGNNVTFNLIGAGEFTVTYDPAGADGAGLVTVTGDIVEFATEFNYETVFAVGNGEDEWLNGVNWDQAYIDNEMTEVADDVWEIEYEYVTEGFDRQVKFAIDGAWTHNFGGVFEESGVASAAVYNGDNITFDTEYENTTVKLQLDLRNFDFATKTGATFTITLLDGDEEPVEDTTEAPAEETTEAPAEETTEAPAEETTEAPAEETTVEETTEAPAEETTEAPAEETTEAPAEEDVVIVAGSPAEIFGTAWDGVNEANTMTKDGDVYTRTYTVDKAYDAVQLKAVVNGADWIGDETGNNVTFNLTGAGEFTVTYDPAGADGAGLVTVTGDIVEFATEFNYETVFAVGNGEDEWLNGVNWDPAYIDNEMTEVADDVWEIEYEYVTEGFDRQVKFAIDGAWTHNFGGVFEESGVASAAVYNGDNITFDTEYENTTVKLQLDLRNFDFATKSGATFTITLLDGDEEPVEDTTEAPAEETTEAPAEETTEAPAEETTVEETTEAPAEETTEAPAEETTEAPAEEDVVIVAGSPAEIFGTAWDGVNEANTMTKDGDVYTRTYTVDKAYDAVQLKAVVNGADWIGDETGNNVTFNLTGAGEFTVTYDPAGADGAGLVTVTGDIVEFATEFNYETVFAVGNGEDEWLNGVNWDQAYIDNEMTEVADDVWEIEYEYVTEGFDRQVKFAIDGAWTHNFGGVFEESGVASAAVYNGDNITFDTEYENTTVKLQLDMRNFDFATKTGATFTITLLDGDEEPVEDTTEAPAEETTEAPAEETTEAPAEETTVEETTEAPAEETTEAPAEETTEAPAEETTEAPAEEDVVIVAGSPAEIFGTAWDGVNEANTMTKDGDVYTRTYTVDKAYDAVQLKAVVNGADWIGDETGNNVTFNLTGAGEFTVTYDPAGADGAGLVTVTGDIVEFATEFNYETVFAVGNGEDEWLNGVNWDPAYIDNEMTEVADDVWEIEYEYVTEGFDRQVKFAIDGAWTHNFGGVFEESGVASAAVYNGDNITFDTEYENTTVKLQLDLRNFDFATKSGATFTITLLDGDEEPVEDTTEAPAEETTEAPAEETTEAPAEETTVAEETTEAPAEETTEAPAEETTEAPAEEDVVIVAGSPAEIFGTSWDGVNEANTMTKDGDVYTRTYTVDKAYDAVQLKAVVNGADWIGDETGNNVTFNLTGAGEFTVTYDPAGADGAGLVTVTGDIVEFATEFNYETVFAVGNGEDEWLNGVNWDQAYIDNEMTEVADDVWEIEYEYVTEGFDRQVKFAIDGAWTHNFGGVFEESGVASAAVYNGDNITFDTEYENTTVKLQLDLRNFDFATKTGATFTITLLDGDEEPVEDTTEAPAEETTEAPAEETTEAPAEETTVEETTEAPAEETTEAPAEETTEAPAEETTEAPAEEDVVIVAGSPAEIFGTAWDGVNEANTMTKDGDVYTRTYTVDKAYDAVQLKAVVNGADWIGDETGNNVTFNLTGAGEFTVTYDPAGADGAGLVTVTGDIVEFATEFNYETVFAVGNGEDEWLNGVNWDQAYIDNEMTEVADDLWEIEYEYVTEGFDRQVKFAIDGAWTHNFGGVFEESGVASAAVYNGDNITFDTEYENTTVKLVLDLRNFDFATKTGATFTITLLDGDEEEPVEDTTEAPAEETTVEETTVEETTVEETTVEETTVEETTVEETTEAPVEETTEAPAEEDVVIVAGSPAEIFGTSWDGVNEANTMTKDGDVYTRTYTVDKAYDAVQLKAVVNGADWIGDETGNNVTFNLIGAGEFTVTYDPAGAEGTGLVTVTGDIVEFATEFNYEKVFAVGNGEDEWLNGVNWDQAYSKNEMTEVAEDVWQIKYEYVTEGFDRQVKFAIDGAWTHNFGFNADETFEPDTWMTAEYNGGNITFDTEYEWNTITLTLDLSDFDFATKTGAKYMIEITETEE